jgi:transcriptional regulator with XRE-family HTH domain
MSTFGDYLKNKRKELEMTMTDVQTVAGISQPSMSLFEKGTKIPSKRLLEKLADLYEVSHDEMFKMAEDAAEQLPAKQPEDKKEVKKRVNVTKVHRFDCSDGHAFYVPLNFPVSIEEMVTTLSVLQCPICHCDSKDITFNMKEYTISE